VYAETPFYQRETAGNFTQELRLESGFDFPVNFTVGAFYEHEDRTLLGTNRIFPTAGYPEPGPYFGTSLSTVNNYFNWSTDYSIYGQLTWDIFDNLELAGGARWTHAIKRTDLVTPFQYLTILGPTNSPLTPSGTIYHLATEYDNVSPQVTLTWHPRHNMTVYGAYKTGFLAGGIANPGVSANYTVLPESVLIDQLTFKPEKAKGEELGLKGIFFDDRLSGDITLYHYVFSDLQVATFHIATTTFTVGNAASAISRGVEVQAAYQLSDALNLHGSLEFADLHFDDYSAAPCYTGQTAAEGCIGGTQNLSGHAFGPGPLTVDIGGSYVTPITSGLTLQFITDVLTQSRSPRSAATGLQPYTQTEPHTLLNATIKVYQTEGSWEAALIGTNLNNATYASDILGKSLGAPEDLIGIINPGREIRLQVTKRF
jgi:outer membrane receptor protein involved in Fe transport